MFQSLISIISTWNQWKTLLEFKGNIAYFNSDTIVAAYDSFQSGNEYFG